MAALDACVAKMRAQKVSEACITAFSQHHAQITSGATGFIPESAIHPADEILAYEKLSFDMKPELLRQTVVMKLNGGLGTGMGLSKAKSLLTVKGSDTFLDLIAKQVEHFRKEFDVPLKFMLMNSFSTSEDTKKFFADKYPSIAADFTNVEVLQNKVPKILSDTFHPAEHPDDRDHEWVPPGHGDLYAALLGSGKLDALLSEGYKYLFVSNSDNLGATLDLQILSHFAEHNLDFLMEVCKREEADKKGGHLARSATGGRLVLREAAQCPKSDEAAFQNIEKHRYFNTNNLWVNLAALKRTMEEHGGYMPLPVIRNSKTLNPTDAKSPAVFQLETAMGAAISSFTHSTAVVVPRSRFAPVKTCNDLLALRSDCYHLTPDFRLVLDDARHGKPPVVSLEDRLYKFVDQFEKLIPHGAPSMLLCDRVTVKGLVEFAQGCQLHGTVSIVNEADERKVASGNLNGDVQL